MTALVTGASSGIGKVFARRLAADGHNLIVVARRDDRLQQLAGALHNAYGVAVSVVVADLARRDDIERVARLISSTDDLDLLVNNAGFGTTELFYESEIGRQQAMLDTHITATMHFTRAALPGMIARRRGTIVNVSSVASFIYGVRRANYCASKAYINVFTQSVQEEVREHGIKLQALCPGFTYTEFHDTEEFKKFERTSVPKFMWMRADAVVDKSLRALSGHKTVVVTGVYNRLIVAGLRVPVLRWLMMRAARKRRESTSQE